MINPRSQIRALDKHWDIIERLVRESREQLTFERDDVLALLAKVYVDDTIVEHSDRLQQLVNAELLVEMSLANTLQVGDNVRQFVASLLHEHELGLSDILKVRINDVKTALEHLQLAVQSHDMAALQRSAIRIDDQLRKQCSQLQQDTHAIMEIAERAKAADERMPLARRYQEVLEAYDHYVLPMTELMDTGAGGNFYPLLEEAERVLAALAEQLATQGGLYSHLRLLRQVGFRVKELRDTGFAALKLCTNTLMPLREEVRRHNQLSAAIGQLLGEVRKKGLQRTFEAQSLPLWRKERGVSVAIGPELLTLMEQVRHYQPKAVVFPDPIEVDLAPAFERVDEEALHQHLQHSLPISDLMRWLHDHYRHLQDLTLLRLYHKLILLPELKATPDDHESRIALQHIAIRLHSHTLTRNDP